MLNQLKTIFLLGFLSFLFVAAGLMIGGQAGAIFALILAFALNIYAYWNADKVVLRMHGAKRASEVTPRSRKVSYYIQDVKKLAHHAGLPEPELYIIDSPQPNAFATGRNPKHAALAATTGLLQALTRQEIKGVMAHELAHVKNRDTLTMTIAAILASAISMLASLSLFTRGGRNNILGGLALAFLAPMAAGLVKMAVSRTREYEADKWGAKICGKPLWLASALWKIDRMARQISDPIHEKNPAAAHLCIINPLKSKSRNDKLFSTHPQTANRIAKLEKMAGRIFRPESVPETDSDLLSNFEDASTATPTPDRFTHSDTKPQDTQGPWEQKKPSQGPWG